MKDKSLKDKAIKIQGKDYVLVSDRINYFNENYKNGSIRTKLLSEPDAKMIVIVAKVIPDIEKLTRYFVGHAQEVIGEGFINKNSAMENAETSAVGRALAMMGIGVIDSIASVDEINKAKNREVKGEVKKVGKIEYKKITGTKNGRKYEGWVRIDGQKVPVFWTDKESSADAKIEKAILDFEASEEKVNPKDVPF